MICGGTISGNCDRGRPRMETTPTTTVIIAMTIATIGRSMKNLSTRLTLGLAERLGGYDGSLSNGRWRAYDHPLASLQAGFDDLKIADAIANSDRANGDQIAGAQDFYLIAALKVGDGALGNDQRMIVGAGDGAYAPVLTRPKHIARVRKCRHQPDG